MESFNCKACESPKLKKVLSVKEMMMGTRLLFPYGECADCGSLTLLEIPENYNPWYSNNYYSITENISNLFQPSLKTKLKALRDRYCLTGKGLFGAILQVFMGNKAIELFNFRNLHLKTSSTILDVGCGKGKLTWVLYNAGFHQIQGLEPFLEMDIHYPNGPSILRGGLKDISEGSWDVIMFNHSFEHIPDPKAALFMAINLLPANGKIFLRLPTVSSEAFLQYQEHWVQLDAPRHVTLFSKEGIRKLAEVCGLQVESIVSEGTFFQFLGSEQYRKDIPLYGDPKSRFEGNKNIFTDAVLKSFKKRADKLNRENHGDSIAIILSKKNKVSTSSV